MELSREQWPQPQLEPRSLHLGESRIAAALGERERPELDARIGPEREPHVADERERAAGLLHDEVDETGLIILRIERGRDVGDERGRDQHERRQREQHVSDDLHGGQLQA